MSRAALILLALALVACNQQDGGGADPTKATNAERYARDRQQCEAQVDEQTRRRQVIDDSRRDVFSDPSDNFGRSGLPDKMAALGDTRQSDRMVERCLQSRGWAKPQKSWWQKITG